MPTLPNEPHRFREVAESFGDDAARYDRARPRYPLPVIDRIVREAPGPDLLDVGIGTGIAAAQFRDAGCSVLGVDVDDRMAAVARRRGFPVEIATIEQWDPAGRRFDAVVAAQTWHWVDPVAGARKVAAALRPGGRVSLFWNVYRPAPELAREFGAVYTRVLPALPFRPWETTVATSGFTTPGRDGLAATGAFGEAQTWEVGWEHEYSKEAWLDQVPTSGGHSRLPADQLAALLDGFAAVIDANGGTITMPFVTVVLSATRR